MFDHPIKKANCSFLLLIHEILAIPPRFIIIADGKKFLIIDNETNIVIENNDIVSTINCNDCKSSCRYIVIYY